MVKFKKRIRKNVNRELTKNEEIKEMKEIKIISIHKAGMKYNYDIYLEINNIVYYIEFKYNANSLYELPQFVSPVKPSRYLSYNYEEFYYDNYLSKPEIEEKFGIKIPKREIFLKQIHSTAPKCMKEIKEKYKKDDEFNNYINELYNNSAEEFIEKYDLNLEKLNKYLEKTQKDKIYMLYKKNKIYLEENNSENYYLISYIKEPELKRYKAETKSGKKITILLRWKNGNGIAFPAFQMKYVL